MSSLPDSLSLRSESPGGGSRSFSGDFWGVPSGRSGLTGGVGWDSSPSDWLPMPGWLDLSPLGLLMP